MKSRSRLAEELEAIGGLASAAPTVLAATCESVLQPARPIGRTDTPSKSGGAAMEYWEVVCKGVWTRKRSSRFFDVDGVGGDAIMGTANSGWGLGLGGVRGRREA